MNSVIRTTLSWFVDPHTSRDLKLIENVWAIMKKKLEERKFTTMASLKIKLYSIWSDLKTEKIIMSIFKRMDDLSNLKERVNKLLLSIWKYYEMSSKV